MNYFISDFYCTQCGNKFSLPRTSNKRRSKKHLKHLYCVHCKEDVNHVECNDFSGYTHEDFVKDFESGKFLGLEKSF